MPEGKLPCSNGANIPERSPCRRGEKGLLRIRREGPLPFITTTFLFTRSSTGCTRGKFATIDVNWFDPSSVPLLGIPIRDARNLYLRSQEGRHLDGRCQPVFLHDRHHAKDRRDLRLGDAITTRVAQRCLVYGIKGASACQRSPGSGQSLVESFQIYAGPKDLSQLASWVVVRRR